MGVMLPDLFKTTDLLQAGLQAAQLRHDVIANNIANIDTPGFKQSRVEFESYMRKALEGEESGFEAKRTRPQHLSFDEEASGPRVVLDDSTTMRMDGNNVDIDRQMAEMARNSIWFETMAVKLTGELNRLKIAIDGR
jgi:flagellar basal-body rod protein FlgB